MALPFCELVLHLATAITSVRVKLVNFKIPKVKALLSKAFTLGI